MVISPQRFQSNFAILQYRRKVFLPKNSTILNYTHPTAPYAGVQQFFTFEFNIEAFQQYAHPQYYLLRSMHPLIYVKLTKLMELFEI